MTGMRWRPAPSRFTGIRIFLTTRSTPIPACHVSATRGPHATQGPPPEIAPNAALHGQLGTERTSANEAPHGPRLATSEIRASPLPEGARSLPMVSARPLSATRDRARPPPVRTPTAGSLTHVCHAELITPRANARRGTLPKLSPLQLGGIDARGTPPPPPSVSSVVGQMKKHLHLQPAQRLSRP
jgi:hypothetical protein